MGIRNSTSKLPGECFQYSDLYSEHPVNIKAAKRMIKKGFIAPLFKGKNELSGESAEFHEECPICFLYYSGGMNRLICCKQSICSECYLHLSGPLCPFCNQTHSVLFTGPLTESQSKKIREEEDRTKQLEEKARREGEQLSEKQAQERRKQMLRKAEEQRRIVERQALDAARAAEEEEVRQAIENSNLAPDPTEDEMIRMAIELSLQEVRANG